MVGMVYGYGICIRYKKWSIALISVTNIFYTQEPPEQKKPNGQKVTGF